MRVSNPGKNSLYDVFICHNTLDKVFVRNLSLRLKAQGYAVWLDEEQLVPGKTLDEVIEPALENARALIVVMGANDWGGYQLEREVTKIRERTEASLVPVLAPGATELDARRLREAFPGVTYLDLSTQPVDHISVSLFGQLTTALGAPQRSNERSNSIRSSDDEIERHARGFVRSVGRNSSLVVFLGDTWRDDTKSDYNPDIEELGEVLFKAMHASNALDSYPKALRPQTNEVARIYKLIYGSDKLEEAAIDNFVDARTAVNSPRYDRIAALVKELSELSIRAASAGRSKLKQKSSDPFLLLTTNIDLRLERSLIKVGTPFMRVVVERGGEKYRVSAFSDVKTLADKGFALQSMDGQVRSFSREETITPDVQSALPQRREEVIHELREQGVPEEFFPREADIFQSYRLGAILNDEAFEVSSDVFDNVAELKRLPNTIIVKLLGSSGVDESAALTSSEQLRLVEFQRNMPALFKRLVKNEPVFFFGFSPADYMFQKLHYVFLREALNSSEGKRTVAVFEGFAEATDLRGHMERLVDIESLNDALQDQIGVNALVTPANKFIDLIFHHLRQSASNQSQAHHGW